MSEKLRTTTPEPAYKRAKPIDRKPVVGEKFGERTVISTEVQCTRNGRKYETRCKCGLIEWVRVIELVNGTRDRCAGCVTDALRAERTEMRRQRKGVKAGTAPAVFSPKRVGALETWMARQSKPVRVRDVVAHFGWAASDVVTYLRQVTARGLATHNPGGIRDEPTWTPATLATPRPDAPTVLGVATEPSIAT